MGLTGKYDFKGIKKFGAKGLALALASTTWASWLFTPFLSPITDFILQQFVNWMANSGLMVINIGAIIVNGELDEKGFNNAFNEGLQRVQIGGLTPEQKKEIDDKVIAAARAFLPYNKPK